MTTAPIGIASRTIRLPDLSVVVRELTVSEVRAWLVELEAGEQGNPLHSMLFDGFSPADLARMCDIPIERLEACAPSELDRLAQAAKGLNPDFFGKEPNSGHSCSHADLDRCCCILVGHGHSNVFNYPWTTYLTALKLIGNT